MRTLITLVLEDCVDDFYRELRVIYGAMLDRRGGSDEDCVLLDEALTLNQAALALPFRSTDQLVALSHNIWDHYLSLLSGGALPLQEGLFFHRVIRSRHHWDNLASWAAHIQNAQGKDKRTYLSSVWTPDSRPRRANFTAPSAAHVVQTPPSAGVPVGLTEQDAAA